ncbi:hypothetical protein SKAU_G00251560 [Synaphobranchus kaupii]|uniref:Uncharacterized protein n=1 Tax=Synaphobranchus kaupii TaxID=118154 RepID=A0A9Q1F328_SYNKA|nr:hypothetical protein SKAU_G00251560 [Synaphobranchus kaupii]
MQCESHHSTEHRGVSRKHPLQMTSHNPPAIASFIYGTPVIRHCHIQIRLLHGVSRRRILGMHPRNSATL